MDTSRRWRRASWWILWLETTVINRVMNTFGWWRQASNTLEVTNSLDSNPTHENHAVCRVVNTLGWSRRAWRSCEMKNSLDSVSRTHSCHRMHSDRQWGRRSFVRLVLENAVVSDHELIVCATENWTVHWPSVLWLCGNGLAYYSFLFIYYLFIYLPRRRQPDF